VSVLTDWQLNWGTDCFLVSLVSLDLIACFMVSKLWEIHQDSLVLKVH
jgi:hypothetical protein